MTLFVKKCQRNALLSLLFCNNTPTSTKYFEITKEIIKTDFQLIIIRKLFPKFFSFFFKNIKKSPSGRSRRDWRKRSDAFDPDR